MGFEGTVLKAIEGELLDRGAGAIGVEADLAEEDTVSPGIGRSRMWIAWAP